MLYYTTFIKTAIFGGIMSAKNQNTTNYAQLSLYHKLCAEYFNTSAVFSDETLNFVSDNEPDTGDLVTIRLRTSRNNADQVSLVVSAADTEAVMVAEKESSDGIFDYYCVTVKVTGTLRYYFRIDFGGRSYSYNKRGLYPEADREYDFLLIPDFKTPEWSKGAVMYQIYIDRFYNGDDTNTVEDFEYVYLGRPAKHIADWNQDIAENDICNFYGGDLSGIMKKFSYLSELGIDAIYLNPVFVSPSNHKYDIQDYDYIDPHIGRIVNDGGEVLSPELVSNRHASKYIRRTSDKENLEASNKLIAELIETAHQNGIRVILDGVFNHCGAFNKWLDKEGIYKQSGYPAGAYRELDSIYHNYFRWYDSAWPNNDCYDSWWNHDNHPKLNYDGCEELYNYMLSIAQKWVSPPYNADGWRLDVAADLGYSDETNHRFWKDFRRAVKSANPDALILAEQYGDPSSWLEGDQWDTVMNYDAFMEPLTYFLTGMEKHSEERNDGLYCNAMRFEEVMRKNMARFSIQSLLTAMNELSNHDHSRFLTRTNMTVGRLHTRGAAAADENVNINVMMEAVIFMMTWPGAPTIYYGDEAGQTGWTDPDNRRTYPWGRENQTLLNLHKHASHLRRNHPSLKTGSCEYLSNDCGILSFGRFNQNESIAVALNNNNAPKLISLPVWKINVPDGAEMRLLIETSDENYSVTEKAYKVQNGIAEIELAAFSSVVLEYSSDKTQQ